jgi:hypothetical protein
MKRMEKEKRKRGYRRIKNDMENKKIRYKWASK